MSLLAQRRRLGFTLCSDERGLTAPWCGGSQRALVPSRWIRKRWHKRRRCCAEGRWRRVGLAEAARPGQRGLLAADAARAWELRAAEELTLCAKDDNSDAAA